MPERLRFRWSILIAFGMWAVLSIASLPLFASAIPLTPMSVVISQAYGGGNTGAPY